MRSVCIIGAGPAGLVAAKTFLQTGQFQVTVYERSSRPGGIWALDKDSTDGFLSPHTPTNLSRFAVAFSDFSWDAVDVNDKRSESNGNDANKLSKVPMFPKAWQVNRYLEEYRRRYIPDSVIKYGREVFATNIYRRLAKDSPERWLVKTKDRDGVEEEKDFDHVVVATGFFAQPRPLQHNITLDQHTSSINMMHSSAFRILSGLFEGDSDPAGKTVLVIGGGNSSGEAAAAVAVQLSNTQWSLDPAARKRYAGCKVVHVTPRPIYALPPFGPADAESTTFMPIDYNFYNLSKRLPGPITGNAGRVPQEVKDMLHGALRSTIGGDQSDLGAAALVALEGTERGTVQVALSESYPEYVRSGLIEVVSGRVTSLHATASESASATVSQEDTKLELKNIGAVIYATGYSPEPALRHLQQDSKNALKFDPNSLRLPLILEQRQTMSERPPNLAFIGFYEGPYWPIMEMQARLVAERWLGRIAVPRKPYEEAEKLLNLRKAMQDRELDVPQYWFGDYAGYMEELATELNLQRNDGAFKPREGTVSPSRYLAPGDDQSEADKVMNEIYSIWHDCVQNGKYVARAAFRALQGNWAIHRRIDSFKSGFPSGTLEGTASFHPRSPTPDGSGKTFDFEYIYIESGLFTLSTGQTMTASRRYVYRYSEADDRLSVWFVKPDKDFEVDYLFHDLAFVPPAEAQEAGACIARADHLCIGDMYWTEYRLPIKGIALHTFEAKHTVKGPNKDYVAVTRYRRPPKSVM